MLVPKGAGILDQVKDLGWFDGLLWVETHVNRVFYSGQRVTVATSHQLTFGKENFCLGTFTILAVGKKYLWTLEANAPVKRGDYLLVSEQVNKKNSEKTQGD